MRALSMMGLVGLFIASSAQATVIVPRTIEEMAHDSACIVQGRVISSQAAWDESHQRIYTTTSIEVTEWVTGCAQVPAASTPAGQPPKTVVIRTLGGEVGEIGMKVAGTEKFTANEEVFLFLRDDPVVKGTYQVVGMSQGKYSIQRDEVGKAMAVPSTEGLAFARPSDNGVLRVDPSAPHPDRLALTELRDRISRAFKDPKYLKPVPSPAKPQR
jgi:hypothetical protein